MSSALSPASVSLTEPRGGSRLGGVQRPLPGPLVPITILSCVLPDPPLPNPFQHHFWFFSGDALCLSHLLHTSRRPVWPPAWAWSGHSR